MRLPVEERERVLFHRPAPVTRQRRERRAAPSLHLEAQDGS